MNKNKQSKPKKTRALAKILWFWRLSIAKKKKKALACWWMDSSKGDQAKFSRQRVSEPGTGFREDLFEVPIKLSCSSLNGEPLSLKGDVRKPYLNMGNNLWWRCSTCSHPETVGLWLSLYFEIQVRADRSCSLTTTGGHAIYPTLESCNGILYTVQPIKHNFPWVQWNLLPIQWAQDL